MTALRVALAGLALDGSVHQPGEPGYGVHRSAWDRLVEHRPAAVVRAASAAGVANAVRLAGEHRLRVAVQTTGHGVVRPADEQTILLLLGELIHVAIEP